MLLLAGVSQARHVEGSRLIAAVLCGGLGTRLRSVIGERQKCAVDVGGRPWIHRVLDELAEAGIAHSILLTGYRKEEVEDAALSWYWSAAQKSTVKPMTVEYLYGEPSGHDDAVGRAFDSTTEKALLVVNGDTLLPGFDLAGFLASRAPIGANVTVRGPSVLSPKIVHSGFYLRFRGLEKAGEYWNTKLPFLDIGSPEGLAEARRRFAK